LTTGCVSIKQNIHLVKNVMLPIDLIPIRAVTVSMTSQLVGLGVLVLLVAYNGELSWRIAGLPLVILLQMLFLAGLVLVLSALAVALPDVSYFVNLAVMLTLFISPIGYKPEMLPAGLKFMVYLNPIHYMAEAYRASLLASHPVIWQDSLIYVLIACVAFAAGCMFFRRFKSILVDYE
jgi:lipopolysaccharide transport system permease protein